MKLGLGSAQLGMDYGITNPSGKVANAEVRRILDLAAKLGVRVLDTAPGYGDSERAIGVALSENHSFRIVTKTPVFKADRITRDHAQALERSLRRSLTHLKQKRFYGLLIHHAEDLLVPGGEHLIQAMERCVDGGLVEKIGVSAYTAKQIDGVLRLFLPGIVQLPISVLDQRVVRSGHLARLHRMGVEVHARSVFLQGVLLSEPTALPAFFGPYRQNLERTRDFARENKLSPLQLALGFVASVPDVDIALVGVTSEHELREIVQAWQAGAEQPHDWSVLACADETLVDPRRWQL